jgi:hypothetical protein
MIKLYHKIRKKSTLYAVLMHCVDFFSALIFQGISVVLPKVYLGGRRDRSQTPLTGSLNEYINDMKYRKYFYK